MSQPKSQVRQAFSEAVARAARRPQLAAAVVGVRTIRYFLYRTRYMLPRALLRTAMHVLELYLLSTVVPWESMGPYFLLRGLTLLLGGMHFGWLEGLREKVRKLYRAKRFGAVRSATARWLVGSAVFGGLVMSGAIAWAIFDVDGYSGFSVFDAFAFACALRIGLEALARTVHSMVYAVRRVHRTLWSLLLPDAIEPIGLIVLFPTWGLWSFAMVALLGGCVRAYLTYAWSLRTLRSTRLEGPLRLPKKNSSHAPEGFGRALLPALTGLTSQVDAVLLVVFGSFSGSLLLPAIYLARPMFASVQGALRTFYFDFKCLEERCPAILQRSHYVRLQRFAIGLGLLAGGAMALSAALYLNEFEWGAAVGLLAFGAIRSLFSFAQVGAFAHERYGVILAVTGLVFGTAFGAGYLELSFVESVVAVTASLSLGAAWLLFVLRPAVRQRGSFPLHDLINLASTRKGPFILFSAELDPRARVTLSTVLRELRRAQPDWITLRDGRARVIGIASSERGAKVEHYVALARASAGTLRRHRYTHFESGATLLKHLREGVDENVPLSPEHRALLERARRCPGESIESFVERMRRDIPQMQAVHLDAPYKWARAEESAPFLALSGLARPRRDRSEFAVLFPGDVAGAYLLFCPYTAETLARLAPWHERLQVAAVALSLKGAKEAASPPEPGSERVDGH